jgi:hypothetical protein
MTNPGRRRAIFPQQIHVRAGENEIEEPVKFD